MSRVHSKMAAWTAACFLLAALFVLPALAQNQSSTSQTSPANNQTTPSTTTKKKKKKSKKTKNEPAAAAIGSTSDTSTTTSTPGSSTAKKSSTASAGTASDSEIAAAKASGKVWVNLDSGIYHKGGRWYGKTKNGKFMAEQEAKVAGYKPAKKQ